MKHLSKELSCANFLKIANRLINEFGCNRISLSGGEPTTNSEFDKILDTLLSLNVAATIVTNGTTNCKKLIDSFNSNNLTIQISLDGSCEEINSLTRGTGNFAKAVNFIAKLDKKNRTLLKMVVSKNNFNDVTNFFEFAVFIGCMPQFDFIVPMGNAIDKWDVLTLTAKEKLSVLRTIDLLNKKHGISSKLPLCSSSCPLSDPDTELSVLIKTNGQVYPCQMLYNEKYCLGNILSSDVSVFDQRIKKISAITKERNLTDFGCQRCVVKDCCKKGCMALAEMKTGSPLEDDGECLFRKLQFLGLSLNEQRAIV